MVPLIIALAVLAEEWADISLAIDTVLYADMIQHQNRLNPGRPGLLTAIAMLILTLASLATTSRHVLPRSLSTGLACLGFCIAILSGTLLPLGVSTFGLTTQRALMSVPTASSLIAISAAILAQRRHVAWPDNPAYGICRRTMQWLLASCILLPVLSALWQLWTFRNGQITPEMAEIIQAAGQVAISCTVIVWAWFRVGRESTTRWALSMAIDAAPIAITDTEGRIIRWSKGCERLYGWTAAEARGLAKYQLTDALLPAGPNRPLKPHMLQEAEIMERHRDGRRLCILESRQIVQPRPDIAPMVVLSMTDITERQRAQEAKLASEARLAFAANLHELGLFEWTTATDQVLLSPHAERLFGFQPGAFTGGMKEWRAHIRRHFDTDILPDEPLPASMPHRRTFRLGGGGRTGETDGDRARIVEGSIFFHNPPGDQGCSMLGIVMDATEREKRTEMLQAREYELRSILDTVPEAMITVDEDGRVRSFSAAAEKLFGYAAEEMAGRDIRTLLPDYAPNHAGSSAAADSSTKTTAGRDRQGNAMPVELVVGETTIGREHISIAFVRSLREQIATQTRLNELRDQLLHASRVSAMGEMGAGLAHELNQPLTATANYLGAAHMRLAMEPQRGPDGLQQQVRELVDLANQEVLRAGEIIRRMRAFVARGELDIRAFPLNELIADALQLAWSGTRNAGVHLHYQPSASAPSVLADQIQIQQVLVNIISNALETFTSHRTERPEIMIHAIERADDHVLIRLADNGPGFPPAVIGRPFEAFMSTRAKGLGLGLSICRRIVESHGGTLTFANRAEGGAVIEFTLPVYRDADVQVAE